TAMFDPFTPPNGSSAPSRAARASVVGSPSGPSAHPGGSGSPRRAASRTLTHAASLAAWSNTRGPRGWGIAKASGFVPAIGDADPNTLMSAGEFAQARAISPASAKRVAYGASSPAGKQFVTLSAAIPHSRAASTSV